MNNDRLINVGDYISYRGNYGIASGPLRDPGVGRIEEFEDFNGVERIYLFLADRNAHIWCDYERIDGVETMEKHLLACGFVMEEVGQRKRYRFGNLVVSGGLISIFSIGQHILTGFCLADFTGGIILDKYLGKDGFNIEAFYKDFPPVNNINSLFSVLQGSGVQLNWDAIAAT